MDRRLVTVSKFLAKHLRHAPEALGLTLQPGGWVAVDDLLGASARQIVGVTHKELDHLNDELGQAALYATGPDKKRLVAVLHKVADLLVEDSWARFTWM